LDILSFIADINVIAAICFILGFIFIIIEMFVPGFGLPGIAGIIFLVLGIIQVADSILEALIAIIVVLAILGLLLTLVLRSAAKGALSKNLILNDSLKKESGFISSEDLEYFLGKEGVTVNTLRPSGYADFDGVKLDVISQGEYIPKGTKVQIIKVEGSRIVVKELK